MLPLITLLLLTIDRMLLYNVLSSSNVEINFPMSTYDISIKIEKRIEYFTKFVSATRSYRANWSIFTYINRDGYISFIWNLTRRFLREVTSWFASLDFECILGCLSSLLWDPSDSDSSNYALLRFPFFHKWNFSLDRLMLHAQRISNRHCRQIEIYAVANIRGSLVFPRWMRRFQRVPRPFFTNPYEKHSSYFSLLHRILFLSSCFRYNVTDFSFKRMRK